MKSYFQIATIRDELKANETLGTMFPAVDLPEINGAFSATPAYVGSTPTVSTGSEINTSLGSIVRPVREYGTQGNTSVVNPIVSPSTTTKSPTSYSITQSNYDYLHSSVIKNMESIIGTPITITSGIRTAEDNARVGGAKNSLHVKGEAADLLCADNRRLFKEILLSGNYDLLIWENNGLSKSDDWDPRIGTPRWVHVSVKKSGNRKNVLVLKKDGTYRAMTDAEKQAILNS